MKDARLKDRQKQAYQEFISKTVPKVISEGSCTLCDNYKISFEADPILISEYFSDNGTDYYPIKAKINVLNTLNDEKLEFFVTLLNLPVFHELGFMIKGNYMQCLDMYNRTPGWTFSQKISSNSDLPQIKGCLYSVNNRTINFLYDETEIGFVTWKSNKNDKGAIPVSVFFRALTGLTNSELLELFGYSNPYVLNMFSPNKRALKVDNQKADNLDVYNNRNECIEVLANAMLGKAMNSKLLTIQMKEREIKNRLFNINYFNLGVSNGERLERSQSFSYRAKNKKLAETIECNGYVFYEGITLTEKELKILDNLPITQLNVHHNNKRYTLRKFSKLTFRALGYVLAENMPELDLKSGTKLTLDILDILNQSDLTLLKVKRSSDLDVAGSDIITLTRRKNAASLNIEDLYTGFSIWADNLNGFECYDKQYELTNRIVLPYEKVAENFLETNIGIILQELDKTLANLSNMDTILSAIPDFSANVNPNLFIENISNTESKNGQMSDMCNLMSFVSKSYKITTDIERNNVTSDMIEIKDTQEGRLDAFDSPESSMIGLVHHKTILSKQTEDGFMQTPYMRVKEGEIQGDEPIYLTSIEEGGKYIASWNETFLNEDGSKKSKVKARIDGNVVFADTSLITLAEYSPIQSMSPTHAQIPFAGHSAGKRITMSCNQQNQAMPLIRKERPRVGTGVESILDIGTYSAKDVLKSYFNDLMCLEPSILQYKDSILNSDLLLTSILDNDTVRTVTYDVLVMKELNKKLGLNFSTETMLEFPHNLKNFQEGIFSYNINHKADRLYHSDDILAVNNGYSLEKKEVKKLVDFGHQKVDDTVFDRGTALGFNPIIAYKTWESSTIDDSITISSSLVDEERLTNLCLFKVTAKLINSDDVVENFGISDNSRHPYLAMNGLPLIGTTLQAGDIVIAKTVIKNGKTKPSFTRLSAFKEGQVIRAEIEKNPIDGTTEACVTLACLCSAEVGDKLSGRYGNKGVIAKIVPSSQMPYDPKTGFVVDIILSPLGVPSRLNASQLFEAPVAFDMLLKDAIAVISAYNKEDIDFVRETAKVGHIHPKILVDGRTGKRFERPINVGVLYMYKLEHMVRKKIHAIGLDAPVDPVFLQPKKGSKRNGGQAFGEMESWCLQSMGAFKVLEDIYGFQSDDILAKEEIQNTIRYQQTESENFRSENNNHYMMQSCYRSLGVEIVADSEMNEYQFKPLTDSIILGLAVSEIEDDKRLHNPTIFGRYDTIQEKAKSRGKWGYLRLHTKLVLPIWVEKGRILKYIMTVNAGSKSVGSLSKEKVILLLQSKAFLLPMDISYKYGFKFPLFLAFKEEKNKKKYEEENERTQHWLDLLKNFVITGMSALVYLFENYPLRETLDYLETKLEKSNLSNRGESSGNHDKYLDKITDINYLKCLIQENPTLSNYVVTTYPIIPQNFRPMEVCDGFSIPDFDWHYSQILNAANIVQNAPSEDNKFALYEKIRVFCGFGTTDDKKAQKYTNISAFFMGKGKNKKHGKLREAAQSKRAFVSGRSVITPAFAEQEPTQLGVPFSMLVIMFEEPLIAYIKQQTNYPDTVKVTNRNWRKLFMNLSLRKYRRFKKIFQKDFKAAYVIDAETAYDLFTELSYQFFEGGSTKKPEVVLAGRQPSLHKYSIRAYTIKVTLDKVIRIPTLVCKGYNADFDGDQSWVIGLYSKAAKEEALRLMSPATDFINPKDSKVILEHTQDISLGVYCATMLKENKTTCDFNSLDSLFYSSLESIQNDLDLGFIKTYDLIHLKYNNRHYLSTAGRILFHSLLPNGFTEKQFSNPLNIAGVLTERYCDLAYDGLITSGKGSKGEMVYYNLQDICMDIYLALNSDCIKYYHNITKFGFRYADLFGISISWEDLDLGTRRKELLKEFTKQKEALETDYLDGLVSEEDKKDAIQYLYSDKKSGISNKIKQDLISSLSRNNNLFIMMDSGARGNESQLMQMCGSIGILQKTRKESMENPVTANYFDGLDSFDVHMTSYSARLGVASTQNETRNAGYATRQVVYMTNGTEIVEHDCGKSDWWFDIIWGDLDVSKIRFKPEAIWFLHHCLDRMPDPNDKETLDYFGLEPNQKIELNHFYQLNPKGFNTLKFGDGKQPEIIKAEPDLLIGSFLDDSDFENKKYLKYLLEEGKVTNSCLQSLEKLKVMNIKTNIGEMIFRYEMDSMCRSLLLNREARNLPYLDTVISNLSTGQFSSEVITKQTLDWIAENGISRVEARILLDCKSEHGICSRCYGLKYSNLQLPEIHELVGTTAAQAIGEPSAQLTMEVINKGGVAGASVTSGVDIFTSLLNGSVPGGVNENNVAITADRNSYIRITKIDESSKVEFVTSEGDTYTYPNKIKNYRLKIMDGEFIKAGEPITTEFVNPSFIKCVNDSYDKNIVLRHRQIVWVNNYFTTFRNNSININARHFELLARIQNQYAVITKSNNPDFPVGSVAEISSIPMGDSIDFALTLSRQEDVIVRNSGALTALTFANHGSVAANLVNNSITSSAAHNCGKIGAVSIGSSLIENKVKPIVTKEVGLVPQIIDKEQQEEKDNIVTGVISTGVKGITLDSLNLFQESSTYQFELPESLSDAMKEEKSEKPKEEQVKVVKMESF